MIMIGLSKNGFCLYADTLDIIYDNQSTVGNMEGSCDF